MAVTQGTPGFQDEQACQAGWDSEGRRATGWSTPSVRTSKGPPAPRGPTESRGVMEIQVTEVCQDHQDLLDFLADWGCQGYREKRVRRVLVQ